jgi:hypothetical protein
MIVGINVRAWRWPCVTAIALCLVALSLPVSAAAVSAPQKHTLAYYNDHPCSLITQSQVHSVFGHSVGPGRAIASKHIGGSAAGAKCEYSSIAGSIDLSYSFEQGNASSEKAFTPGPYTNEPSVGHNTFCVAKGFSTGSLYADLGNFAGSSENLSVVDSSCSESVQFAKDAFARLS